MDKVSLFNRLTEIELEFKEKHRLFLDFLHEAGLQMIDYKLKVITSIVTVIVQNGGEGYKEYESSGIFDFEYMRSLPAYSRYNPFVWMRIYSRKTKQLKQKEREYRRYLNDLLQELREIDKSLGSMPLKKQTIYRLQDLRALIYKFECVLENKLDDTGDFIEPLQLAFFDNWKMSKNNFLSLLSVNHDLHHWDGTKNETMHYIAALPEEIDYNTFQEAVFINRLEHDRDCYLFDMYMDDMLRTLNQNKEMSGKVFEKFQEEFGPIPTYTIKKDIYGFQTIEPNKPNLTVVH